MTPPKTVSPSATRNPASPEVDHPIAALICSTLDDKKAEAITPIDVARKCSFADMMIVATGRGARHVVSLAEDVAEALEAEGYEVLSIEGKDVGDWVLIDAGDVIVHLFRPEVREFYNLEKMWAAPAIESGDSAAYL